MHRSKFGKIMFNFTNKLSLYIIDKKWLFYILTYTWGLIGTIFGYIIFYFVRIFLRNKIIKKEKFITAKYIMIGLHWGGFSCPPNFLIAGNMPADYVENTKLHELGHTYQNAILGPLVIFIGVIPSIIRYWYQENRKKKGKEVTPYDLFWYEGSATIIGKTIYKKQLLKRYKEGYEK